MNRILKTELYKLRHNYAYWLILLLSLVSFLWLGLSENEKTSFNSAIASAASIVPLFGALVVISIAQSDYNEGTMKNVVCVGVSRTSIYIAKIIAAFIGSMGVFLIEAIISIALAIRSGSPVTIDALFIIKSLLLQAVVVLNYTVIYYLLGNVIRSSALAVSLSFVFYLFGAFAFGYVGNFLHISGLTDYELGSVASAVEKVNVNTVSIMHLAIVTVIIFAVGAIGAFIFKKQDIK